MIRRMTAKHPEIQSKVQKIHKLYYNGGLQGCGGADKNIEDLKPCPPAGAKGRKPWTNQKIVAGPIGLLIQQINRNAAVLDCTENDFVIRKHREVDISILKTPWQFLGHQIEETAKRCRDQTNAEARTLLENHKCEIDHESLKKAYAKHSEDDQQWLRHYANLGIWDDRKLATFNQDNEGKCSYCGAEKGTAVHLALFCPHFKEERFRGDDELQQVNLAKLPAPMKLGMPVHNMLNDDERL